MAFQGGACNSALSAAAERVRKHREADKGGVAVAWAGPRGVGGEGFTSLGAVCLRKGEAAVLELSVTNTNSHALELSSVQLLRNGATGFSGELPPRLPPCCLYSSTRVLTSPRILYIEHA